MPKLRPRMPSLRKTPRTFAVHLSPMKQTLSVESTSNACTQDAVFPSIRGNNPLTSCSAWPSSQGFRPARGARIETCQIGRVVQMVVAFGH